MARIRRPKKIDGSEYTFGGGSGATSSAGGDFVKIAKGSMDRTSANHSGFLSSGDTVTVVLDAGTSIPTKDQYIYFDNAFETETGSFTYEFTNGDTALPAGVSWTTNVDSTDTDTGEARFYGTPSAVGTNTFKIKANYPRGTDAEQVEITYVLKVLPTGTTPVWDQVPNAFPSRFIRNTAEEFTVFAGPTTTYSGATYTLSNVSGFAAGVTPIIESDTGRVYLASIGDIQQAASDHSLTINADLGEYGVISRTFTGNLPYGDAYGARYFGPANARTNFTGSQGFTLAQSEYYHNPLKNSGALRRVWDTAQDTSPYLINDGYGCQPNQNYSPGQGSFDNMSGYYGNGIMGIYPGSQVFASGSNWQCITGYWTVPVGVTSISAVVVGAGGNGSYQWAQDGGGGGGLAWMNGISVTPGEVLQWCWGLGHTVEANNGSYGAGSSWLRRHSGGPNTEHILFGQGGGYTGYSNSNPNGQSTSYTGGNVTVSGIDYWQKGSGYGSNQQRDGGGWGVNTSEGSAVDDGAGTLWHYGGGAAHYAIDRAGTGAGGYRGNQNNGSSNQEGWYGGGGNGYDYSSTHGYGAGGGVGLDGQGWRGTHGSSLVPRSSPQAASGHGGNGGSWTSYNFGSPNFYGGGGGGSGGTRGAYGENQFTGGAENGNGNGHRVGGMHGGGGGGSGTSSGGGHGAPGGVRIIWGLGEDGTARSFPYTYCSEKPSMKYNGEA